MFSVYSHTYKDKHKYNSTFMRCSNPYPTSIRTLSQHTHTYTHKHPHLHRRGWTEITRGAEIAVPRIIAPVLKYVTPVFIAAILIGSAVQDLPDRLAEGGPYIWAARALMVGIFVGFACLVRSALGSRRAEG